MTESNAMAATVRDGPQTKAIQDAMATAGVGRQSDLHELRGKSVLIGDYLDVHPLTKVETLVPGGPATIDYAIGERFRATMAGGRQPWGLIADLKPAADGSFTYDFPEGA